ncbi:MAG: glutamyl-tRNA reductase, partial [Beijerinckiaceae bacterium]|nr:glutamyl-tRNA reductase [Beijerinckiaceae bacterium]
MTITLIADVLVASLLVATIITCYVLTKRIERLKADEAGMRQTVGALIAATDTAERAIAGLKNTLGDCDRTLAERLQTIYANSQGAKEMTKTLTAHQ